MEAGASSSVLGPLVIAKTTTMSVISEEPGDLFAAPSNAILVRTWGAGIAATFKQKYPGAFKVYSEHCGQDKSAAQQLLGTCLLIPPQPSDVAAGKRHWIACLLTSVRHGAKKDTTERILEATRTAAMDLISQVEKIQADGISIGRLYGCRFNSGHFGVRWEQTRSVLENVGMGLTVLERPKSLPQR